MINPLAAFQEWNLPRQHHSHRPHLSQPLAELKTVGENHPLY